MSSTTTRWMTFREDMIRRPDGSEGIYSYIEKPDFALIMPLGVAEKPAQPNRQPAHHPRIDRQGQRRALTRAYPAQSNSGRSSLAATQRRPGRCWPAGSPGTALSPRPIHQPRQNDQTLPTADPWAPSNTACRTPAPRPPTPTCGCSPAAPTGLPRPRGADHHGRLTRGGLCPPLPGRS